MDDNDVMIQEMSDTGSIGDNENTPIVSEAESEVESDIFEISPSPSGVLKTNAVFPKINLNFTGRRKHVSHLKSPSADVIREEPQCFLVDTKLVDPESVEESCSKWTTSVVSEQPVAELVYIGSSSSSASDANDQESVAQFRFTSDTTKAGKLSRRFPASNTTKAEQFP
ncbi:hypothetical protein HA402_001385 [Bradysia odoriphaga]|nr:hypothetical protein HA402_001385 [Bradysia odoriphaga]